VAISKKRRRANVVAVAARLHRRRPLQKGPFAPSRYSSPIACSDRFTGSNNGTALTDYLPAELDREQHLAAEDAADRRLALSVFGDGTQNESKLSSAESVD
jgi:hypothetical protein